MGRELRRRLRRGGIALAALLAVACGEAPRRPHILFLLADDLGWGDVGYHGSEIRTPNIDRLAAEGVRLEQFYTMQSCTPARAALLTGRYPFRYGREGGVVGKRSTDGLSVQERTLAEALRAAGYRTVISGKWHLGHARPALRPMARGFDHQYGGLHGTGGYFTRWRGGELDWYRQGEPIREPGYTTDLIADEVVRILRGYQGAQPLFLYVPFTAPHTPLETTPDCLERYPGLEESPRRTYAAMVSCLDAAIGRILAALEERGLLADTLVVFSSDNGAAEEGVGRNAPLRGGKRSLYEGGIRVPTLVFWRGVLEPGTRVAEPLHVVDWYPTLLKLAGASLDQPLPLDGRDAWPTIARGAPTPHEEILHRALGWTRAIRRGDRKLVVDLRAQTQELFDIAQDPYERNDLAAAHPEEVAELSQRLRFYGEQAPPRTSEQPSSP
jgi:arylsulfatase A-like enzyme